MFGIRLSNGDKYLDTVSLKCINCKIEIGLDPETSFTGCMMKSSLKQFNAILHHVGMSWIISSNQEIEYEMNTERNHIDWLNKCPWYNINICYK